MEQQIIEAVAGLIASGIAAAAIKVLLLLAARFKFQISASEAAQLEAEAKKAILLAEEWAANKYGANSAVDSGEAKLEKAVASIVAKIPNVSEQEAADAVHTALPQMGLGALAGAAKLIQAAQTAP